jgi:hypothetical protein
VTTLSGWIFSLSAIFSFPEIIPLTKSEALPKSLPKEIFADNVKTAIKTNVLVFIKHLKNKNHSFTAIDLYFRGETINSGASMQAAQDIPIV